MHDYILFKVILTCLPSKDQCYIRVSFVYDKIMNKLYTYLIIRFILIKQIRFILYIFLLCMHKHEYRINEHGITGEKSLLCQ